MKKKLLAFVAAVGTIFAGLALSSNKTAPTFTAISPLAVAQGLDQTVIITGTGFGKNTSLLVNGVSYPLNITSSVSGTFTFSPAMTQAVGFLPIQVRNANLTSNTLYFQVCAPLVITTDTIRMTTGVPIGQEGQIQTSGGCIWPVQ